MADDSEPDGWTELASKINELEALQGWDKIDTHIEVCLEHYNACLVPLLKKNREDLYITAPQTILPQPAQASMPSVLELHFGQYRTNAALDELVGLFSLRQIKEEASEDKYTSILVKQLENCINEVEAFAIRLDNDQIEPPTALVQIAVLRAAAKAILKADEEADRLWKEEQQLAVAAAQAEAAKRAAATSSASQQARAKRSGTVKQTNPGEQGTGDAPQGGAGTERADMAPAMPAKTSPRTPHSSGFEQLPAHAATFGRILEHARQAKANLADVVRALRDQRVRDRIRGYLQPLARYYEDRAGRQSIASPRVFWLAITALIGAGAYLILWNALFPSLGPPTTLGASVAVAMAFAFGLLLWRGRAKDRVVQEAGKRLRQYITSLLKVEAWQRDPSEGEMLSALNKTFIVGVEEETAPPAPKPSLFKRLREIVLLERGQAREVPTWRDTNGDFKPILFVNTGPVEARGGAIFGAILITFATALVVGLVPAIPRAGVTFLTGWAGDAQIVSYTAGREACEIAKGRIVWQDDTQIYLAGGSDTIAVRRDQIAQIRYAGADTTITPCHTQKDFFGKGNIEVVVPEPKVHLVVAPAPDASDVTITTVPIEVTIPGDPPRSVLQFYSSVFVDGVPFRPNPPSEVEWNHVIMPLFTNEVKLQDKTLRPVDSEYADRILHFAICGSTDLQLDQASAALKEGWCQGWEVGPPISVAEAIKPITEALALQRQRGCSIAIDVMGFASDKPFEGADEARSAELNWLLAEGRRAAVLLALGFSASSGEFELTGAEKNDGVGTLDLTSPPTESPAALSGLPWSARFQNAAEMATNLKGWLYAADTPPADMTEEQGRFAESLQRSVVIDISRKDLAECRTASAPDATVAALPG